MENLDQQSDGQIASVTALRVQLGDMLMRERLSQQKDEVDVARRLMLSKHQLLAIESGEAESFHHERRYIQGIKSYVFYLGLHSRADVTELLAQIEGWSAQALKASPAAGVAQLHRSAAAPVAKKSYSSRGPRSVYYGLALMVLGAVALAISEGWPFWQSASEEMLSESAPVASDASVNRASSLDVTTNIVPPVNGTAQTESQAVSAASAALQPQAQSQPSQGSQASKTESVPEKIVTPPSNQAVVPQNVRGLMRIDFNADCWVSLQTVEGTKEERIYKQGESLSVPTASVSGLVLGNAPAAKVFLSGQQVDVLAKGLTYGNVTRLDQKSLQLLQKN